MEKVEKPCQSKPQEGAYHEWSSICWNLGKIIETSKTNFSEHVYSSRANPFACRL